jgi:two-component system LytT family sensor kinase
MNRSIERKLGISYFNLLNFGFWVLIMVIISFAGFHQNGSGPMTDQLDSFIVWPLSFFISIWTISYLAVYGCLEILDFGKFAKILALIIYAVVLGIIQVLFTAVVSVLLVRLFTTHSLPWEDVFAYLTRTPLLIFGSALLYYIYFSLLFMLAHIKKLKEKNVQSSSLIDQLDTVQLNNLKMQMRPHFLFNALNTVAMMVRQERSADATEMLASVSDMLRLSLASGDKEFSTLEEEITLINKLLTIEKFRFEERLTITVDVDEGVEQLLVPTLIFQPLVENAFKHGVAKTIGMAEVSIRCYKTDETLILEVYNTGPNLPEGWELQKFQHIGLANTSARLTQLYPSGSRLIIEEQDNGILVTVKIPIIK